MVINSNIFGEKSVTNHYIYKIIKDTGEFYVGMRSCKCLPENDEYWGSGTRIKRDIKKYGLQCFIKEILISNVKDRETLATLESQIVTIELLSDPMCLNLIPGGRGRHGPLSDEHKRKIGEAMKGNDKCKYKKSDEHKRKIGEAMKGRHIKPRSDDHYKKGWITRRHKARK